MKETRKPENQKLTKSFQKLREKMSPESRGRALARTNEMLVETAIQDLKKALDLTQEQVAEAMQMNQAAVSKMEHQSDIYVSTLRKFIEALGGHVKIVASFPDREVVINQFD
jgi:ribosome-binding protein aMBF1 (putative translation factor)